MIIIPLKKIFFAKTCFMYFRIFRLLKISKYLNNAAHSSSIFASSIYFFRYIHQNVNLCIIYCICSILQTWSVVKQGFQEIGNTCVKICDTVKNRHSILNCSYNMALRCLRESIEFGSTTTEASFGRSQQTIFYKSCETI